MLVVPNRLEALKQLAVRPELLTCPSALFLARFNALSLPACLRLVFAACFALLVSASAMGGPEDLGAWEDWVLERHPDSNCPVIAATPGNRRCAWPGKLLVDVNASGTNFTQHWQVYGLSWLRLPGGAGQWPQKVTIDGRAARILDRSGHPTLRLEPGTYTIKGVIRWNTIPQYLLIPADTGLIELTLLGKQVLQPNLRHDRILLRSSQSGSEAARKNDEIRIEVFRKLSDGVPLRLDSELRVAVSGKPREILIGQLLPTGAEIIDFVSPLPARVEADGRLRIQARPGQWVLSLRARYKEATTEFGFSRLDDDWPEQEVWVFSAAPRLRGVTLSGASAVDPTQLKLPDNWNDLPTWVLTPDSPLQLTENWRGDETPAANDLQLTRTLWLDFDGTGATVKDVINGSMSRDWRLEVDEGMNLGRITVNGEPQLVTTLADSAGVEVRQRNIQLEAISRLDAPARGSATGWQSSFRQVGIVLNLPPGWKLWNASGPDSVEISWLSQWDLWDLFLCLLIIGSSLKLLGLTAGLLALASLALSYHVVGSPVWAWLLLLVAIPLLRALPVGRFQKTVERTAYLVIVSLTLVVINFSVQQIRSAIYPQLERAGQIHHSEQYDNNASQVAFDDQQSAIGGSSAFRELREKAPTGAADMVMTANKVNAQQRRYQPAANVQTGPGEPKWRWRQVNLRWNGPVHVADELSLWLSPPWLSRLLNVVELGLIWAYLLMLIHAVIQSRSGDSKSSPPQATAIVVLLSTLLVNGALVTSSGLARAEEYPPQHLLKELEQRLIKTVDCLPSCAAINQSSVELDDTMMTVRMRVTAGASIAFPLPVGVGWQPKEVLVDGVASYALARTEGGLQIALPPGDHSLLMVGPVTADSVKLPFQLSPHNISVSAPQWEVIGLVDKQLPGKTLELRKKEKSVTTETLLPEPATPFIQVRRQLTLDIDWTIDTTVYRIAPAQGAISVNVPLLSGESVVSPGVNVDGVMVLATIGANERSTGWRSVLEPVAEIELECAPQQIGRGNLARGGVAALAYYRRGH